MMAQQQQQHRPTALTVSGCKHPTVGSIVVGDFLLSGENHHRPVYKRTTQVKGFDVLCYFWDDRDGPDFSGWWFGPKVGGDQVWAYHPSKAMAPPPSEWKVPYGGDVDPNFRITATGAGAGAQPMQQQMGAAAAAAAAWGMQAQGMQQQHAAGAMGQQQLHYQQQQQLQAQQQQAYQQQQAQQQAYHQQQQAQQVQQQQAHQQQKAHQQTDWGQQQLHQQQQQQQQQQQAAWGQQAHHQQSHQQQGWGQQQQQQQPQQQQQQQPPQQQQQSWGSTSGSGQQGQKQQGQRQSWDQGSSGGGYNKSQSGGSGGWDKNDWGSWNDRGSDRNKSSGGDKSNSWDRSSWHSKQSRDWNQSSWDSSSGGGGGGGGRKSGWDSTEKPQPAAAAAAAAQPQQPGPLPQQQQQQQQQGQHGWGAQQNWGSQQAWGNQMQQSQASWAEAAEKERQAAELRQKQQEELKRKVEEEKKKKQEAEQQRMRQQKAAFTIRKVLMKVRAAGTEEGLQESKAELEEVLAQELQHAGNLKERIQEECTQGIAMGQKRVDAALEQKRKEQERKEAEAKAREEREARAKELVMELTVLVEATESDGQRLTEASEPLQEVAGDADVETIKQLSAKVNDAATKVKGDLKACSDFIIKNATSMKETPNPKAALGPTPIAQELSGLMKRISDCKKNAEGIADKVPEARNKALRRCHARERQKALEATFMKYDNDKDSALSRKETVMYAKEEFQFQVDDGMLTRLWNAYVEDGAKGFTMDNFHLLKAAVGVAREQLRDVSRREVKMAKQKAMDAARGELADKVKSIAKEVDDVDKELTKLEKEVQPLQNKVKTLTVEEIIAKAAEVEKTIATIRENTEATRKRSDGLSEGVDNIISDEIKSFLASDATSKKMLATLGRMDPRLRRVEKLLATFREAAERKEAEDLEKLRQQALRVLWHNQRANEMTLEELFKDVDSKGDGKVDEEEFVRWFENADVEVREPLHGSPKPAAAAAPKDGADAAAEAKPEGAAEEGAPPAEPSEQGAAAGESKPAEAAAAAEPTDKVECIELPAASVKRIFTSMLLEGATAVPEEDFMWFLRGRYIVIKPITLTSTLDVKEGDTVAKLELGDVLDVLQGPKREEATGVLRLLVRLTKDGTEGWVTHIGNQGSAFLKKGGSVFKILKESALTEGREVEEEADGGAAAKLKVGELLEVREGPVEVKPGVLRVRGRARGAGASGWVTTRSEGTFFAKPL